MNMMGGYAFKSSWSEYESMTNCCERGKEPIGFLKIQGNYYLTGCLFLKRGSAPCSNSKGKD